DSFDIATSRAVADLRLLCELCLPYVAIGGRFLAMKSVDSDEEVEGARNAIGMLGGRLLPPYDYTIPGTEVRHRVVIIEKIAHTPKGLPRRWAKVKTAPL
ncbi:MAG: RsmG family class I SAM-dependent methyltransferase, partial [Pseudoflavonifractor sp.]